MKLILPFILALLMGLAAFVTLPQGQIAQAQFEVRTAVVTGPLVLNPLASQLFTATGFEAGEAVSIYVDGTLEASGNAGSDGVFTSSFSVARNLAFGDVGIAADNGSEKSAVYTPTIEPVLAVNVGSGVVSSPLTVAGFGFAASEPYTITFTDAADAGEADCLDSGATITDVLILTGTTTAWGSISKNSNVPAVDDGEYYFVAIGQTSDTCAVTE